MGKLNEVVENSWIMKTDMKFAAGFISVSSKDSTFATTGSSMHAPKAVCESRRGRQVLLKNDLAVFGR